MKGKIVVLFAENPTFADTNDVMIRTVLKPYDKRAQDYIEKHERNDKRLLSLDPYSPFYFLKYFLNERKVAQRIIKDGQIQSLNADADHGIMENMKNLEAAGVDRNALDNEFKTMIDWVHEQIPKVRDASGKVIGESMFSVNQRQGYEILKRLMERENLRRRATKEQPLNFYEFIKEFTSKHTEGDPSLYENNLIENSKPKADALGFQLIHNDSAGPLDRWIQKRSGRFATTLAKVYATHLSNKFGIKAVFADLGNKKDDNGKDTEQPESSYFDPKTGQIIINVRGLTPEVAFHEYLHPFYEAAIHHNPALAASWKGDIMALARENPTLAERINQIIGNKSPEDQDKEMFTYFTSVMMDKKYRNKIVLSIVKDKLMNLVDRIYDALDIPRPHMDP